jgi:hypothetical protein
MSEQQVSSGRPVGRAGRVRAWLKGPWGQMVVYLAIFFVLGAALAAFFIRARGPARGSYAPWDAPVDGAR